MHTLDLIAKAAATPEGLAGHSRALGVNPNALSVAKQNGGLSPAMAALLADRLKEPVMEWTLTALQESHRNAPLARQLAQLARRAKS